MGKPRNGTDAVRALSCWRSAYLMVLREVCESLFLALQPTKLSGSSTEHMTEMTRQMTLVEKARGERNFRQREIRLNQHLLGAFDSLLREIDMRGHPGGLLKLARKMMH